MNVSKHALIVTVGLSIILVAVLAVDPIGLGTVVGQQPQDNHSAEFDEEWLDDDDDESDDQEGYGCMPANNSHGTSSTPMEYAKMIETELGVPPVVDCGASVEMPIYVDGVKTTGNPGLHCCDNPSLAASRFQNRSSPPSCCLKLFEASARYLTFTISPLRR